MPMPPDRRMGSVLLGLALAWGPAPEGSAAEPSASKEGYHLFRPTPRALLRDMSTDRPDLTESPYTVDAGHIQLEIETASYTRDEVERFGGVVRMESVGLIGLNAKVGLLPSVDLHLGPGAPRWDEVDAPDSSLFFSRESSGITDLVARVKWNLWGNDGGPTAMALMPFLKLPTGSDELGNGEVEGGLIVPLAVALPGGAGLGAMAEVDWLTDGDGSGHHAEWVTTATVGRPLAGDLGGFLEIAATFPPRREGPRVATFDAGLTYGVTPDLQLDGGVMLGLSEAADGFTIFSGISIRR